VYLVRTDVLEERIASIIRMKRIRGRKNISSNLLVFPSSLIPTILMMETISFSETSVLTRATRRHIVEEGIVKHFFSRVKLKLCC
jgi:hypothetical protein